MKAFKILMIFFIVSIAASSCNKDSFDIEFTGMILETGITTYQYGSHTISGNGEFYALRSNDLNLDDFVGQEKSVKGNFIDDYPVDGGPEYIEVIEID